MNSGNWQARTYNDASGQTTNLATTPITVSAVQILRIELDAAEVRFYINGVLVATHETQVPDEGMGIEFIAFQMANPGTASNLNVDAVRVGQARNP